jgi:excisionase family DNA binding protein
MTDQTARTMIDSDQVAELIGSPRRHVHTLVDGRKIPHYKIGGLLRFDRDEILGWIEAQRREAAS